MVILLDNVRGELSDTEIATSWVENGHGREIREQLGLEGRCYLSQTADQVIRKCRVRSYVAAHQCIPTQLIAPSAMCPFRIMHPVTDAHSGLLFRRDS